MKKNQYILFLPLLFLSLLSFNSSAQELTNENTYLINQYFQLNKEAASVVQDVNKQALNNTNQNTIVSLNQIGNENEIEIKSNADNSQQVTQQGNQNQYSFISYYNSNPSNFNILQQGTSNSLQIYGQNSIIENITIIQKSNAKTLIINNY